MNTPSDRSVSSPYHRPHRKRRHGLLAGLAAAGLLLGHALHAQTPGPGTPPADSDEGIFWEPVSGAYSPQAAQYSGLFRMKDFGGTITSGPGSPHVGQTLTWFDMNPEEGVYDFHWITDTLNKVTPGAGGTDGMAIFRLKSSVLTGGEEGTVPDQPQMIPQWVVDKYSLTVGSPNHTFHTGPGNLYAAPWHYGVQKEWRRFILMLGRTRLLENPRFAGIYLNGLSRSGGEEMNIDLASYALEADTAAKVTGSKAPGVAFSGLVEALEDFVPKRMQAWNDAVGSNVYKVAWIGTAPFTGYEYNRAFINDAAEGLGLGYRGGFVENYFYASHLHPPRAAQSWLPDGTWTDGVQAGYVISDWTNNGDNVRYRYLGEENEETDEYNDVTDGSIEKKLAAESAYFRSAQIGANFLWVENTTVTESWARKLPAWFKRVAGTYPEDSPDAVVWLRQAKVKNIPGATASGAHWKNLERLLMQRDIADCVTVPAVQLTMPDIQLKAEVAEYTARRTNVGSGNNRHIAFAVDPAFKATLTYPLNIKVHYLDNSSATWLVRVARANNTTTDLGTIVQSNDGQWKTATFTLLATNAFGPSPTVLGNDIDFLIRVTGAQTTHNVTVRYVSVSRYTAPTFQPVIKVNPIPQTVQPGDTATLNAILVHSTVPATSLQYQWQRATAPGGTYSSVSGGTALSMGSTLGVPYANLAGASNYYYRLRVNNTGSTSYVYSAAAQVKQAGNTINDTCDSATPWASAVPMNGTTVGRIPQGANPSPDGGNYLKVTFSSDADNVWQYAVRDVAAGSFSASNRVLRFWIKGVANHTGLTADKLKVQLREGPSGERWNFPIGNIVKRGTWQLIEVPITTDFFTAESGFDGVIQPGNLTQVRFYADNYLQNLEIHVDGLRANEEL